MAHDVFIHPPTSLPSSLVVQAVQSATACLCSQDNGVKRNDIWPCLGRIRGSRSYVKVHGHIRVKKFTGGNIFSAATADGSRGCAGISRFVLSMNLNMNVDDVEFFVLKWPVRPRVRAFLALVFAAVKFTRSVRIRWILSYSIHNAANVCETRLLSSVAIVKFIF